MKDGIYLIIDDTNSPCGLTDRLKAAVGLCYAAMEAGIPFRLIHTAGFDLRRYLVPAGIDWSAEPADLEGFAGEQVNIRYVTPYTDLPEFRKGVQYICREYIGNNLIEKREVPDWQRVWRELFRDLFRPTDLVLNALNDPNIPDRYAAVVFRFINSLGHTEDVPYNAPFPADLQQRLIAAALEQVYVIQKESEVPLVVYSDSVRFLREAAAAGYRTVDRGSVGNIMNPDAGDAVALGTFVNLFRLAKAEKIWSVLHLDGMPENSLYNTQYPRYAAIIGDRPFVRI